MTDKKKTTLSDDQMITDRPMGRRSSFALLGAGVLGAAGLVGVSAMSPSQAQAQCTDSDSGGGADPAGRGRGRGVSDRDPSDPAGCGRRACSDSDPNDPAGRGRHC